MDQKLSIVGPHLFMDTKGKLFEKNAGVIQPVNTPVTQAEDRFVQRNLGKGVLEREKN